MSLKTLFSFKSNYFRKPLKTVFIKNKKLIEIKVFNQEFKLNEENTVICWMRCFEQTISLFIDHKCRSIRVFFSES